MDEIRNCDRAEANAQLALGLVGLMGVTAASVALWTLTIYGIWQLLT